MSFRDRLRAGELLSGTFVKTPHPHVVEVLALSALDCLVLDAEHAPFERAALDVSILAARAGGKPVLVRPPAFEAAHILNALDCGADGVLIPHIRSAEEARAAARACRYDPGGRGYTGGARAGLYGTKGMTLHRAEARNVAVIAQIEDAEAVEAINDIATVDGIDALFVGRADLTIAYGAETPDDPRVIAAVERICAAGRKARRPVGMFLAGAGDIAHWRAQGASLFILSSDHEFLLKGAGAIAADVAKSRPS